MMATSRSAFVLMLLALVLCFAFAEASPGWRPPRRSSTKTTKTKTSTTPTSCSTTSPTATCTPTAVQTQGATLTWPASPPGAPGDGYDLVFSRDWGYIGCAGFTSSSCGVDQCLPECCNKGACGPISTTTDLFLNYPNDWAAPDFHIVPRSPATHFTLFEVTCTSADFLQQYPSVTVEISTSGGQTTNIIIPKPSYGQYSSSVSVNFPSQGLGYVERLDFLAYFTGSEGSNGPAPGGRVYAMVRFDADGTGAGIRYEAYTPLGCGNTGGYRRREEGMSVSPMVLVKRTLEGDIFA